MNFEFIANWKSNEAIVAALLVSASTVSLTAQTLVVGTNVNINRQSAYQAEEAVAIDPTNPNRMFAWSNDLAARNSAGYTTNGGASWISRFTGSDGWPALGGDPTCTFDTFGNLYGGSFSSDFGSILVRVSTNGGQTFPIAALTISAANLDQPTVKAGPGTNTSIRSIWILYFSPGGLFARGANVTGLGVVGSFGAALSIPGSGSGNFGDITIGPTGKVAVAYQTPEAGSGPSTIVVAIYNGSSFVQAAGTVVTAVGGFRAIPAQPSRTVDAEVGLAYDISTGPHRGRLYMAYTDAPTKSSDDLNIFSRYSDNDGATWSTALKVNTDASVNSQFFPKLALDPTTGNIGICWYDCRSSFSNNRVELWGTVSVDGGVSFLPEVKISTGSTSGVGKGNGNELGDYIGLDFYNNVMYPVWADDSNSTGDNPDGTANLDFYGARVSLVSGSVPPLLITGSELVSGTNVITLSWTNTVNPVTLQGSETVTGAWNTVSTPRTTNNNTISTVVTNLGPQQFYRLKK